MIKLKSSLRTFNGYRHGLDIEYLCHRLRLSYSESSSPFINRDISLDLRIVKQKLLTHMDRLCSSRDISGVCVAISEHLSSPLVFRRVRVTRSLILLCFFLLAIVLSVLRYTDYDCPFGIF